MRLSFTKRVALFGAIGAFVNWFLRGGGIESALLNYKSVPGLKIFSALIFGGLVYLVSHVYWHGLVAAPLMWLGASFSWGSYIKAMKGDDEAHGRSWGLFQMCKRGVVWTIFLVPVALLLHSTAMLVALPLVGLLMGPVYYGFILLFEKIPSNKWLNHWTCSEQVFGFLLFSTLALVQ